MHSDKSKVGGVIMTGLVLAVIVACFGVVVSAVMENRLFSSGSQQVLTIVSLARDIGRDRIIGSTKNEDILGVLARSNRLPMKVALGASLGVARNPWDASVTARIVLPNQMRIEVGVPSHVCRRMARFFWEEVPNIGLVRIEAREVQSPWRPVFDTQAASQRKDQVVQAIGRNCGTSGDAALALVLVF